MSRNSRDVSLVYWYPNVNRHRCGYCKDEQGNLSNGMWAEMLSVDVYQDLIDRGWRRSGKYCYKPVMNEICCPTYTIRCDATNFKVTKSQKKVIKRVNKYLNDGIMGKPSDQNLDMECTETVPELVFRDAPNHLMAAEILNDVVDSVDPCDQVVHPVMGEAKCINLERSSSSSIIVDKHVKSGVGADPNKPPCKKAKLLRLEKKKEKLLKQGKSSAVAAPPAKSSNEPKSLEELCNEIPANSKHKLRMTLERLTETHELFAVTSKLFEKYQIAIHNDSLDECNSAQYHDFLVDTPLLYRESCDKSEVGFGSFHQLYWLDEKLIAVGVIDILPKCVSAVYFFYDPDYRNLTLGTYGSLREVELTRSLHDKIPSIRHYYMGYYIHSCQKMRYKGKLVPSFLLCPESYQWIPIENCLSKLDASKYARLSAAESVDENRCSPQDIDNIRIVYTGKPTCYRMYRNIKPNGNDFNEIALLIGQKCSKSLVFIE